MPDDDHNDQSGSQTTGSVPSGGDDERETREQIDATGEPDRDKLGNADGAS